MSTPEMPPDVKRGYLETFARMTDAQLQDFRKAQHNEWAVLMEVMHERRLCICYHANALTVLSCTYAKLAGI